jgi:hypothetical protein
MNKLKCPHGGIRLGNHLYADARPSCRHELEHDRKPLISGPANQARTEAVWPIRWFLRAVRFVES